MFDPAAQLVVGPHECAHITAAWLYCGLFPGSTFVNSVAT